MSRFYKSGVLLKIQQLNIYQLNDNKNIFIRYFQERNMLTEFNILIKTNKYICVHYFFNEKFDEISQ
jgi:hypothetical protein